MGLSTLIFVGFGGGNSNAAETGVAPPTEVQRAIDQARQLGEPVKIDSLDSRYTTTYAKPDGALRTDTSVTPIRVLRDGNWVPVDYTLKHVDGAWTPQASPVPVAFSDGSDNEMATLGSGTKLVELSWDVALPEPTVDGARATYDLGGGEELVLTATARGFEQSLVLTQRPMSLPRIKLPFEASSLTMTPDGDGGYTFSSAAGTATYTIAAPMMYGSAVDDNTGLPQQHAVSTTLVDTPDGPRLDLAPSLSWLTDPETVYPVTIDPIVTQAGGGHDTFVQGNISGAQGGSSILHVGMYGLGQTVPARALLKFDSISTLAGGQIQNATLKLWNAATSTCTPDMPILADPLTAAFSDSSNWLNKPGSTQSYESSVSFAFGRNGCPSDFGSIDVTAMVSAWASGALPNYGLQLRGLQESGGHPSWDFCSLDYVAGSGDCNTVVHVPTLTISWVPPPDPIAVSTMCAVPAIGDCASPETAAYGAPTLIASTSDPNGEALQYNFELWRSDGTNPTGSAPFSSGVVPDVPSGEAASYDPPDLQPGAHFEYRVKAWSGSRTTAWSPWFFFTIGTADVTNKPTGTVDPPPLTSDQTLLYEMDELTDELGTILEGLPLLYTGMEITPNEQINVYVPPVANVVDDLLAAVSNIDLNGIQLNWITVPNSLFELQSILDLVRSDIAYLASQGLDMESFGPDPATGLLEIDLINYTPAAAQFLSNRYGAGNVEVVQAPNSHARLTSGRFADNAPWYGGDGLYERPYTGSSLDLIYAPPRAYCTTGANLIDASGHTWATTAAHCWPNGKVVFNGANTFGTISHREWTNRANADVELIRTSGSLRIFNGWHPHAEVGFDNDYAHTAVVTGMRSAQEVPGNGACYDGANTGTVCRTVVKAGYCQKYEYNDAGDYKYLCDAVKTCNPHGAEINAVQGGDSGGPVYIWDPDENKVKILGAVEGALYYGSGADTGCDFYVREKNIIAIYSPLGLKIFKTG